VSLTSADSGVSQAAAKGLRILAETDRQPGAPVSSGEDREDRLNRNSVYEQLGDPNVMIVGMFRSLCQHSTYLTHPSGRVGHQKRIRKLVRSIARPSATHVAIWQECFWRWRSLSEVLIEGLPDASGDSKNNRYPIPLSLEVRLRFSSRALVTHSYTGYPFPVAKFDTLLSCIWWRMRIR